MSDQQFKAGDVVQLKSGGPIMTVADVRGSDAIICVWFDRDNKENEGKYPAATLEIYREPKI